MGVNGSTLMGKAEPNDLLLPFSKWEKADLMEMKLRHKNDLGGVFALSVKQFQILLNLGLEELSIVKKIFKLFDTDQNRLIDAFECMGAFCMVSKMPPKDKLDFVHSLYDFNATGQITCDEMTMLMRTLVYVCAKMDNRVCKPQTTEFEKISKLAFSRISKKFDTDEIEKWEFDAFCLSEPRVKDFLDFWRGGATQVLLDKGEFYTDKEFPDVCSTLYINGYLAPRGMPPYKTVQWRRFKEICAGSPVIFPMEALNGSSVSKTHIIQGSLANCWLLSAFGILTSKTSCIRRLFVSTHQEAQGRFTISFYKEGNWNNVVVDDRMPCNVLGKPIYAHGTNRNEIWMMVLEKAYAKLHGCYELLNYGTIEYALRDLTGGEVHRVDQHSQDVKEAIMAGTYFHGLKDILKYGLAGAVIDNKNLSIEGRKGLLYCKAYTVLSLTEVKGIKLVKLRNSFGQGDYTGDWCNGSKMWNRYQGIHDMFKPENFSDGVFVMAFTDFIEIFNTLITCRIYDESHMNWKCIRRTGEWPEKGGGCTNSDKWYQNQQFFIDITEDTGMDLQTMLTQQDPRYHYSPRGIPVKMKPIGLIILKFDWDQIKVDTSPVQARLTKIEMSSIIAQTEQFHIERDIYLRTTLPKGKYVIIPLTFEENLPGKFWLTFYGSKDGIQIHQESPQVKRPLPNHEKSGFGSAENKKGIQLTTSSTMSHLDEEKCDAIAIRNMTSVIKEQFHEYHSLLQKKMILERKIDDLREKGKIPLPTNE